MIIYSSSFIKWMWIRFWRVHHGIFNKFLYFSMSCSLSKIDMWVQVHNLPSGFISEKYSIDFGNFIGRFLKSDLRNYTQTWRESMRIRVHMDVRKPIKRKLQVKKPTSAWEWVDFKYERLNVFCYFCGVIGHTDRFCRLLYDMPNFPREKFLWGPWLVLNG